MFVFLSSTLSVPTAPAGLPVPFPCDSARVYADVVFRHIMRQRFTFESTGNHHGSPAHVAVFGNPQIEQPQSHRAAPDPYDLMAGWQQHSHIGSLSHRTASAVRRLRWWKRFAPKPYISCPDKICNMLCFYHLRLIFHDTKSCRCHREWITRLMQLLENRGIVLMDKMRIAVGVVVGDRCVERHRDSVFRVMISSARQKSDSCIFIWKRF